MVTKPHSQLTTKDHAILQTILERHRGPHGPFARLLEQKLRSSSICFRDDIPPGVVTLNTRLTYRINGVFAGPQLVVQSEDADLPDFALSIHAIRGLALLGLEEGASITVHSKQNNVEALQVESVLSQPEAEARIRDATSGLAQGRSAPATKNVVHFVARPVRATPSLSPIDDDDPGPRAA